MYSSIIRLADSSAAAVWPVTIALASMVTIVTVVAMFRAPRSETSKVFTAFAAAFGFRHFDEPDEGEDHGRTDVDDQAGETEGEQ